MPVLGASPAHALLRSASAPGLAPGFSRRSSADLFSELAGGKASERASTLAQAGRAASLSIPAPAGGSHISGLAMPAAASAGPCYPGACLTPCCDQARAAQPVGLSPAPVSAVGHASSSRHLPADPVCLPPVPAPTLVPLPTSSTRSGGGPQTGCADPRPAEAAAPARGHGARPGRGRRPRCPRGCRPCRCGGAPRARPRPRRRCAGQRRGRGTGRRQAGAPPGGRPARGALGGAG